MKKFGVHCGVLLLLLCLATGCQNSVNSVENADKNMTPQTVRDKRFVTDGFLQKRLALRRVITTHNADGLLQVQLEAINIRTGAWEQLWSSAQGDNPYQIAYKFTWFDGAGFKVDTLMSDWQNLRVIPGETINIVGIAPNKACQDFRIDLKENN